MPEVAAIRTIVETPTETVSAPEHRILAPHVRRHRAFWTTDDRENEGGNWDALAAENEIHAAISTFNEAKEERKSRENVAFLMGRLSPGTRVLDLGCGYGRLAKYLLPGMRFEAYVGVDCSPVMLKKFHERYAASEAERATPLVLALGDIDRIPLKDATIDACIVSAVYLHNHKDVTRRSIAEIRRVLRPGGRVMVISSFPSTRGLTGLQGWAYLSCLRLIGQGRKNGPVRYFTRREVAELFAGFRDAVIHPFGFSVLPKTILGLPTAWQVRYRRFYDRLHAFLERRLPEPVRAFFCVHFDVVASV
ncbi:MAG: class I SAM-dependent methyltransferase [Patescibacteria group bacterium]